MVILENFYIRYYEATNPKYGYNLEERGSDGVRILSPKIKENLSKSTHTNKLKEGVNSTGFRYVANGNKDGKHSKNPWSANVTKNDISYRKRFSTIELAAKCADRLVLFLYGPNEPLNYPQDREKYLLEDLKAYSEKIMERRPVTSKYINVNKQKKSTKWMARVIDNNDKRVLLGFFETEVEAAIAHDKIEYLFRGKDSGNINFPNLLATYDLEDIKLNYNKMITSNKQRNRLTTSKYRGVSKHKQCLSLWSWELRHNRKRYRGTARSEELAAKQYDLKAVEFLGPKAQTNFPLSNYLNIEPLAQQTPTIS